MIQTSLVGSVVKITCPRFSTDLGAICTVRAVQECDGFIALLLERKNGSLIRYDAESVKVIHTTNNASAGAGEETP